MVEWDISLGIDNKQKAVGLPASAHLTSHYKKVWQNGTKRKEAIFDLARIPGNRMLNCPEMSQSDMAELLVNPFLVNMKSFSVKRGYSLIDKDAAVSKKISGVPILERHSLIVVAAIKCKQRIAEL